MKKRLFLDRVDVHGYDLAINKTVEFAILIFPDSTQPSLVIMDEAVMCAEMTFCVLAVQLFVKHSLFHGSIISGIKMM